MKKIKKVGVIGGGLMGSGIAQVSAAAGFPTTLTSSGIRRPSSCRARMTPSAIWSFAAKIAVTSGLRPRANPC